MKNKIRLYNKKHLLRGLVSVGFLLLIFCLNSREVCAETPTVVFDYETIKNVNNEDEVEITGCTITGNGGDEVDIVIPKTINVNGTDLPVTSIGQQAFDSKNIKSVNTSDVLYVGNKAFAFCEKLISVNMPKVTQIGKRAFDHCTSIESVEMPNVTEVGESAFINCDALRTVEMPDVKNIGNDAFRTSEKLVSVSMPNAKSIGENAFYSCTLLESITIDNVTSIEKYAFYKCTNLNSVTAPKLTSIEEYAFDECTNLNSVTAPKLTSIGKDAFYKCTNLNSVTAPKLTSIGDDAFVWCTELTGIELPEVTIIGDRAFKFCSKLTSLNLPEVTSIGYYAFKDCTNLESIILPKATSIAQDAFNQCDNLKNVYVSGNADGLDILQNVIYLASPISLDKENLAMEPGESTKLNVTVPQNANDPSVSWESSNNNVVSVDDSGNLTAIGGGTVTITVTANDVGKATATCEVTVIVHASKIFLDKNSLTVNVGDKDSLNVGFEPDETTNRDISWTSSDSDVVSVDSLGNITAKSAGKAVVTATLVENNEIKSECVVTVKQAEPAPDPDPDPDPDPEPEPEPIPVNETFAMNQRLYDSLSRAANLGGSQTVYFEEYNGKDCITGDVLDFLTEHPNVTLVLDYTFFDEDTKKDIHCHVVINQAILSKVMRDDIKYYGAAILSGFVQYYDDLPAEIKNKNL